MNVIYLETEIQETAENSRKVQLVQQKPVKNNETR